jgi:exodeoxyribonuclease-1
MSSIETNLDKIRAAKDFGEKLSEAYDLTQPQKQVKMIADEQQADSALYDGFIGEQDKTKMSAVRAADAKSLADINIEFDDERLRHLLPLYKARNYPSSLKADELAWWENFRSRRLLDDGESSKAAKYFARIEELQSKLKAGGEPQYLLEELVLYGQSILPLS